MNSIQQNAIATADAAMRLAGLPTYSEVTAGQSPAPSAEPVGSRGAGGGEAAKLWCETCEGTGKVHQEHQDGCWVGGTFDCPDCDGKGHIVSTLLYTAPPASQEQARCPSCGTHEVALKLECHNSGCTGYALPVAVYEGWKYSASQQQADICPGCHGSGEGSALSGGGPDAYDVLGPCQTCGGSGEEGADRRPEPVVTHATVRSASEDVHIECRFSDGQKFAAVTVAQGFDNLANRIASMLNDHPGAQSSGVEVPANPAPAAQPMTDEQIDEMLPRPDGSAEANITRVEVSPGLWGTEHDEVAAWSKPLVRQVVRAVEARCGVTAQASEGGV